MNIAILIPELCGGGAQRVAQILGNYYAEKGNNVYYFMRDINARQDYRVKGKIIKINIKTCMEEGLNKIQIISRLMASSLMIRKQKRKYNIDVAISFMEEFNYLNILSKGREKVIVRVCTILSKRPELKGFVYQRDIVKFFYSKADKVVIMSQYAFNELRCYFGIPMNKIVKIPNAVVSREAAKKESEWQYGDKVIICVARLDPVKQQDRIIRAFSYVKREEKQAKLLLLGRGPSLNYLSKLCKKYQIEDSVFFEGFTNNLPYYLKSVKAFVMASKVEGFPNSMIEAMNYGVPVITTDSPGACGEIVGKSLSKVTDKGFKLCKYGILTPDMPNEKLEADSQLTEPEIVLGEAMLEILINDNCHQIYSRQSLKRANMFHIEKVIQKWNKVIYESRE